MKNISSQFTIRIILKLSLILAFVVSLVVVVAALRSGANNKDAWATAAAALAVITSVVSSWSAQRSLEQQEDARNPNITIYVDNQSRVGLLLLRVRNNGASAAHDISIRWSVPLLNAEGNNIQFGTQGNGNIVYVLQPNENLAILIDGQYDFFEKYTEQLNEYAGVIHFKDTAGRQLKQPFRLSIGQLAGTIARDTEPPETLYRLQKLPEVLDKLTNEVHLLRRLTEYDYEQRNKKQSEELDKV